MKKTFIVEIEIAEVWIEDGFELETPRIQGIFSEALELALPFSEGHERKLTVKQAGRKAV